MSTARAGPSIVDKGFRALEAVLVVVLAAMVVMVFANVVLRYGFGSGITNCAGVQSRTSATGCESCR